MEADKEKTVASCIESGFCNKIQGIPDTKDVVPPQLPTEYIQAWQIWEETVDFSGFDINGYPQLTDLDSVMNSIDISMDVNEYYQLRQKIRLINKLIIIGKSERMPKIGE